MTPKNLRYLSIFIITICFSTSFAESEKKGFSTEDLKQKIDQVTKRTKETVGQSCKELLAIYSNHRDLKEKSRILNQGFHILAFIWQTNSTMLGELYVQSKSLKANKDEIDQSVDWLVAKGFLEIDTEARTPGGGIRAPKSYSVTEDGLYALDVWAAKNVYALTEQNRRILAVLTKVKQHPKSGVDVVHISKSYINPATVSIRLGNLIDTGYIHRVESKEGGAPTLRLTSFGRTYYYRNIEATKEWNELVQEL